MVWHSYCHKIKKLDFAIFRCSSVSRQTCSAALYKVCPPTKFQLQIASISHPRSRPQDEDSVTDEINISWSIPKDDGGFPITGYRIEMLDIQTNNWIEVTFVEVCPFYNR